MRLTLTVSALALAAAAVSPASAQQAAAQGQTTAQPAPAFCPDTLSKTARNALAGYNDAVAAGDATTIAAARVAAEGAAKTDVERCVLGQIDLSVAVKANNDTAIAAQAEKLAANPSANKEMVAPMLLEAAKLKFNAKDFAGASILFERVTTITPNDGEAYVLLARAHANAGRVADAPTLAVKGIALEKAAGRKAPEDWYKQAVQIALDANSPAALDLASEWVSSYPSAGNWRTALQVLGQTHPFADADMMDIYRLKAATKSFVSGNELGNYAYTASKLGFPGEAVSVIKAGLAAGTVQANNSDVATTLKTAQGKVAGDKAALAADTAKALSSGNARGAMAYGDANYGYGNYAKAAEVYRAVAGMSGGDVPTANLRLGMSLAMAGDKAGAQAALKAVTGPKAAIAQYWLAYVNAKA